MMFPDEYTPRRWDAIKGALPQYRTHIAVGAGILLVLIAISWKFLLPPAGFPTGRIITVPADATVSEIATVLEDEQAIRSSIAFKVFARITGNERSLSSGIYLFDRPLGVFGVMGRIAHGEHGIEPTRVTLIEGMTVREMATRLEEQVPGFDRATFLDLASTSEGYLFPDTYFFLPTTTAEEAYQRMQDRFTEQVTGIEMEIEESGQPLDDLIIMASLLEKEAQTPEDMRLVAGILWNRMEADMPLQVDAVFGYIHGRSGYAPTGADLEIDSPYNTYLYKGLPPTPIANPGLAAILAAAQPADTDYVYYLTGTDGQMRYARTFDEHKENRRLYLD